MQTDRQTDTETSCTDDPHTPRIHTASVKTTRRLAIANRSRVSIPGRPCKNFPHIQFDHHVKLVVVSHTVCAHVGGHKILGTAGPRPLEGSVSDPKNTPHSHVLSY